MKIMATLISAFALVALSGCSTMMTGGGEFSMGMRMDNFLVIKHTTDSKIEGVEAKLKLSLDPEVWGLLAPKPAPAPAPQPETP